MGWWCKLHARMAHARARGISPNTPWRRQPRRGGLVTARAAAVHVRSRCGALRLWLVMRHTVIARLGLRVSLRAGLSGLYRAGKAHIYLHAD
jgi:hypothetical protein